MYAFMILCLCAILCAAQHIQPPKLLIVKESETVALNCLHHWDPEGIEVGTILNWRKDGKLLRQLQFSHNNVVESIPTTIQATNLKAHEDARILLNKANSSLIFASIIASDAGLYICELETPNGAVKFNGNQFELQVVERLKFVPQPTSKNLEIGTVGKVHCKAQGTPSPRVNWMRDLNVPLPEFVSDINGTLIFRNVSTAHSGTYTCIARNSQGEINATVSINAVIAPKFLMAPNGSTEVPESGSFYINCQALGVPTPTIKWDKDLQYLNENNTDGKRFHFHANGTLEISDVRATDEGRYGCTIGSSAGFKREEALLIVQSNSNSMIKRIIIIIICLAFLYFMLILSLKLCCRDRRLLNAKVNLNDVEHVEAHIEETDAEQEPWLTEANSNRNQNYVKSKKLRESTIIENESQVADDIV